MMTGPDLCPTCFGTLPCCACAGRRPAGRPPVPQPKSEFLTIRVTTAEHDLIIRRASHCHVSVPEYVRRLMRLSAPTPSA